MERLPPLDADIRARLDKVGWLHDPRAVPLLRSVWSGPDPDGAIERLLGFLEAADGDPDVLADDAAARRLIALAGSSRGLMRHLIRAPRWLLSALDSDPVGRVRSTLARVAADDLSGIIDVEEGGRILSRMADQVVEQILAEATAEDGPALAIMALGKWGGNELNYWSDIDLIFVFDDDPDGASVANRVAAAVMRRLAGDGPEPVLHADADLRPEGSRGPLARSLHAYRSYYERWAEPWEFQALLKVRHAAGDPDVAARFLTMVNELLWPETIDPDAIRSLRALKARVEEGSDPGDLKRAPGGIRDIEFAIQILQLVHGRFDPDLRKTSTLELLEALTEGGYVPPADAANLAAAYRWLRAAEHRIQLWDLRQSHALPTHPTDIERLARSMGYRDDVEGTAAKLFESDLLRHRSTVRRIHEDLYFRPLLEAFAATPATGLSREGAERRLRALGFRDIERAAATFETLTTGLSRRSRLMQQMLPLILDWLADSPDPDLGLDQLRLLAAGVVDHADLITALHDRPVVGRRLAYLLGSSRLLGRYLDRIPEFVPRLDDDRVLVELRPAAEQSERLVRRVDTRPNDVIGTIRRSVRRQFLRVSARDLLDLADVDRTMADLTASADAAMVAACHLAGERGFAVIAMGRWGGRELSYGSDLDLLYVYDEPMDSDQAQRAAQRIHELLAKPAQDGIAWDLDANLRPEGRSGPLVRSLESYAAYYERWAEPWEYQSLIKARPVAGDVNLGRRFIEAFETHVWRSPLPTETVLEIRRMKARVESQRIPRGEDPDFHLKLGPGGLVDTEFLVQLHQLRLGGDHPAVRSTSTLGAIEGLQDLDALSPAQSADLAAAYRFCTHVRNRLYLQVGKSMDWLPTEPADERRLALSLGYQRRGDLREDYRRLTRRARRIFEDLFYDFPGGPPPDRH